MDAREALQVVDYQRRVAELYAEVRHRAAAKSPRDAWHHWLAGRDRLFHTHPQSPWARLAITEADEIGRFEYDPAWRLAVTVEPPLHDQRLLLPHSGEGATPARPVGTVEVPGGQLTLYWLEQHGGGLFLPFTDATSGRSTYGGGRYLLDTARSADLGTDRGRLILDFNFAFHPGSVHDPRWSSPLAPAGNRLDIEVRAGEHLED